MQNQVPPEQTPPPQNAAYDPYAPQDPNAQQNYQQSPYAPASGQAFPGYAVVDKDINHIDLLGVFHYVQAGLMGVGLLFIYGHYKMMSIVFNMPHAMTSSGTTGLTPAEQADVNTMMGEFMDTFLWFYFFMGSVFIIGMVANFLSARWMRQRKNRLFSMIISGFNCLMFPLGTVLGVFTLIVLNRTSVAEKYFHAKNSR